MVLKVYLVLLLGNDHHAYHRIWRFHSGLLPVGHVHDLHRDHQLHGLGLQHQLRRFPHRQYSFSGYREEQKHEDLQEVIRQTWHQLVTFMENQ